MNLKLTHILSSYTAISLDIHLVFVIISLITFLIYMVKFHKLSFKDRLKLISELIFRGIQLILQNSVKMTAYLRDIVNPKYLLLFNVCITFFFTNFFLASLNNSYIELDKSNMIQTIEGWLTMNIF